MTDNQLSRRDVLRAGAWGSALLAGGAMFAGLTGCSAQPGPARGFRYLREADVALLAPLVPVVMSGAFRDEKADTDRTLALLDETLGKAGTPIRGAMFELYDFLQLGAVRWWFTGHWAHPADLDAETRTAALQNWRDKDSAFAQTAFRGLTQPLMMVWYAEADNGLGIGYPGPPVKVVS